MSEQRCENCRFWEMDAGAAEVANGVRVGYCVRFPPVFTGGEEDDGMAGVLSLEQWSNPVTEPEYWCGEWKAEEAT